MDNYEALLELTRKVMEVAVKNNRLYLLLGGVGLYRIETLDANRDRVVATQAIMITLHKQYKLHPEWELDVKFRDALIFLLENAKMAEPLDTTLKLIEYQLDAQKSGEAPFSIDGREILQRFQNRLANEVSLLQRTDFIRMNFVEILKNHYRYLEDKHGIKLV